MLISGMHPMHLDLGKSVYNRHTSILIHSTHAAISGMCARRSGCVTVVGAEDLKDAVLG